MYEIIFNPVAGKGRAAKSRRILEARLRERHIPHRFHETRAYGDAVRLTRRLTEGRADGCDIVAMGGDGTLSEVLNGIADPSKARLASSPAAAATISPPSPAYPSPRREPWTCF